jgi:hypothetical protein
MRAVPHYESWSVHLAAVRNEPTLQHDISHVSQSVCDRGRAQNVLSANVYEAFVTVECHDLCRHAAPEGDRQDQTGCCDRHGTELEARVGRPRQQWHRGHDHEKADKPRPHCSMPRNQKVRRPTVDPHRTIETMYERQRYCVC